jgi:hypothetical protein
MLVSTFHSTRGVDRDYSTTNIYDAWCFNGNFYDYVLGGDATDGAFPDVSE